MAGLTCTLNHILCFHRPLLVFLLTLALGLVTTVQAIDCYKCTSINGMAEECEDTFNRDMDTVHLIARECYYGWFKGTHCIKFKGEREDGTRIVVRDCSNSDWGHHCGDIRYLTGDKEQMITGCLEACHHDGCNKGTAHVPSFFMTVTVFLMAAVVTFLTLHNKFLSFS